jgi:hypothetical protein
VAQRAGHLARVHGRYVLVDRAERRAGDYFMSSWPLTGTTFTCTTTIDTAIGHANLLGDGPAPEAHLRPLRRAFHASYFSRTLTGTLPRSLMFQPPARPNRLTRRSFPHPARVQARFGPTADRIWRTMPDQNRS